MDATFWAFVSLVIFLGIVVYLKVPGRIMGALDSRADAIRQDLDDARKMREEAQALLADYQRRQQEAEGEAEAIIAAAQKEASLLAADAKQKLDEFVVRRTQAAEDKISQAEAQAISEVRARAADIAIAATGSILGDQMQGKAGEDLISQSIKDVQARLG
jgi:F-type H+-transporting ATPase subunit b